MTKDINQLTQEIIGAAIEVHSLLGPGLLEKTYQTALLHELRLRGLKAEKEEPVKINYKGVIIETAFRMDIIVEDSVILELKATETDHPIYSRQLNTYLRLADKRVGLLINFNRERLVDGLKRIANNL